MAGKGPRQRPTDFKKYQQNYPKTAPEKVSGFTKTKGNKLVKTYK